MDQDPRPPTFPPSVPSPPPAPAAPLPGAELTGAEPAITEEELRQHRRRQVWLLLANIVMYGLALEATVETLWRGTPLQWELVAALLVYLGFTAFNWKTLQPMVRLFTSLLYLLGIIVFAVFELGASSNTGLWMAGLGLDRLMLLVVAASIALTAWLLLRLRFVRRRWPLVTIFTALSIYSLIPIGVAVYFRLPFEAAARGLHYWTWPPYWMQGVYVATQGLVPLGFLLATGTTLWALLRGRTHAAVLPGVAALILLATFAAASIELTRAHVPNVSDAVYMHYWTKFHPQKNSQPPPGT